MRLINMNTQRTLTAIYGSDGGKIAALLEKSLMASVSKLVLVNSQTFLCICKSGTDMRSFNPAFEPEESIQLSRIDSSNVKKSTFSRGCYLHLKYIEDQQPPTGLPDPSLFKIKPKRPDDLIPVSADTLNKSFTVTSLVTVKQDISLGGVTELKPGLWQSHYRDNEGRDLYFVREKTPFTRVVNGKITQPFDQWMNYYLEQGKICDDLYWQLDPHTTMAPSSMIFRDHNMSQFSEYITQSGLDITKISAQLKNVNYASSSCMFYKKNEYPEDDNFVLYVSTKPVKDYQFHNLDVCHTFDAYQKQFGHIAMIVSASQNKERVIQRGIFKPPLAILNKLTCNLSSENLNVGGLSTALTCFTLHFAKAEHKSYVTMSPMTKARTILETSFKKTINEQSLLTQEEINQQNLERILGPQASAKKKSSANVEQHIAFDLSKFQNPLFNVEELII